jgi:outer membrane protein OmpA-like peptidoglycan-associated protein
MWVERGKKTGIMIFVLIFMFSINTAQVLDTGSNAPNMPDGIVKMHGYVLDTLGMGSNKLPVKAKLVFESIPYGSEIGIISSDDSSGYYEFYINTSKQYHVKIESDFHASATDKIEILTIDSNGEVRKDFYLQPEFRENQVFTLDNLIFGQGQASITSDSYLELNRLVGLMAKHTDMVIQLEGHTDFRGSKSLNMELSEDRVEAVKAYLERQGINGNRIKTKAYGGTQPLTKEGNIEAASINRRVEVRVLKIN